MMAGKKIVLQHPAYSSLLKAAKDLEAVKDVKEVPEKAAQLVNNARASVRSATEVLLERDPLKQRLGFICLLIEEATDYRMDKINGEMVEVVEVTNDYLFSWAVRELHSLPVKFST
jgi:hypothetical protein